MYHKLVYEPQEPSQGTIILMPGRGGSASEIMFVYRRHYGLEQTRIVALQPFTEWYVAPKGPNDQQQAIESMKLAVPMLDSYLSDLEEALEEERSNMALIGFSAGAVMAIQTQALAERPFGAVVSHSGAILAPEELPDARHQTPILLTHKKDDDCFKWGERFLPMKEALLQRGYRLETVEKKTGGHKLSRGDIQAAASFLSLHLPSHPAAQTPHV